MSNLNEQECIFTDYNFATMENCIGINTDAINELLNILTYNEFRFLMFMSRYIKGNTNLLYYSLNKLNSPSDIEEISSVLDINYDKCKNLIESLVCKNIFKIKKCKFFRMDVDYRDIIILNNTIFFPSKPKDIKKDNIAFYNNFDEFILEDVLKLKNKPRAKLSDDERNSVKYQKWRFKALERDGDICQCCGRAEELEVHHIESYATNVDLRLDLNNAMTLCKNCHSVFRKGSFHDIHGKYDNNRAQLEEYLLNRQYRLFIKGQPIDSIPNNEQLKWRIENKNLIKCNIAYITSDKFDITFPNIMNIIGNNKNILISLLKNNCTFDYNSIYKSKPLYKIEYRTLTYMNSLNPKDSFLLYKPTILFYLLGFLNSVNNEMYVYNKHNQFLRQYHYDGVSNCFTLPEYSDEYFIDYENMASKLLADGEFNISKEYLLKNLSKDIVNNIFNGVEWSEDTREVFNKTDSLMGDIMIKINNTLESQGYINEKEFTYNEKYKNTYGINNFAIYYHLGLARIKSGYVKEVIDIKEKREYMILCKSDIVPEKSKWAISLL